MVFSNIVGPMVYDGIITAHFATDSLQRRIVLVIVKMSSSFYFGDIKSGKASGVGS